VSDRPTVLLVGSAGPDEGRGHLSRLVTLAEVLGKRAAVFLELNRGSPTATERDRLAGAGVRPHRGVSPDAIVVDLPQPDDIAGRWAAERLVVFDDSHRLTDPAAVVVQPSLPIWSGRAEVGTVLAGYAYAPIRPSLRGFPADRQPVEPAEVVVCFGGSDPHDVSARLAPAVAAALDRAARLTVILGGGYTGRLDEGAVPAVVHDPADLDERLARATLAVIGGGTMKFELAHLGVPSIVVAVADDQLAVGPPFATTGAARFLGDGRMVDPAAVGDVARTLLDDPAARRAMAAAGRAAVDGRGAERVADAVLAVAGSS
jgi:spore coat polysaccharide biosynthesis predicted glycosyltransferase SpsG